MVVGIGILARQVHLRIDFIRIGIAHGSILIGVIIACRFPVVGSDHNRKGSRRCRRKIARIVAESGIDGQEEADADHAKGIGYAG